MKSLKWAAVAVTTLFALMNLGVVPDGQADPAWRIVAGLLCLAGIAAAVGLAVDRTWGRAAVVAVGGLNIIASVIGLIADQQGAVIGLVVGGLGATLGALSPAVATSRVAV
jgi:hypothetical protein